VLVKRLGLLNPAYVQYVTKSGAKRSLIVSETDGSGAAELTLSISSGREAVALKLSGESPFCFLSDKTNADGHLLIQEDDASWTAHVIECKKTVRESSWQKASAQIRASAVRLQIMADFLGVAISRWHASIAFRTDRLSGATTANPVLLKVPLGGAGQGGALSKSQQLREAWEQARIEDSALGPFGSVNKVQLDAEGFGSMPI